MSRQKGNKTERGAKRLYERAGFHPVDRVGSTDGGRRMTDAFGFVDIIAIGGERVHFAQVKTNTGKGIREFAEWAYYTLPDYVIADFLIRHDGAPGGNPPPSWRLQRPHTTDAGVTYRTVVDERKDDTRAKGASVVEFLRQEMKDHA